MNCELPTEGWPGGVDLGLVLSFFKHQTFDSKQRRPSKGRSEVWLVL